MRPWIRIGRQTAYLGLTCCSSAANFMRLIFKQPINFAQKPTSPSDYFTGTKGADWLHTDGLRYLLRGAPRHTSYPRQAGRA